MTLPPKDTWDQATPAQRELLEALDSGLSISEIAANWGRAGSGLRRLLCEARKRCVSSHMEIASRNRRYNAKGELLGYSESHRPAKKRLTAEDVREALQDVTLPQIKWPQRSVARLSSDVDLLDVMLFGDMHLGMMAHHEECGHNWDTDISLRVHNAAFADMLGEQRGKKLTIVAIGDVLHANDHSALTPRSKHILDTDTRFYRTMRAALELFAGWGRVALERYESVDFEIIRGNHDPEAAMALSLALQCLFANEPRVTVPYNPAEYRYQQWGSCLIGFTHADKAGRKRLPLIYATQAPEVWASSKHRHIYSGHVHSEHGNEERGITVESLQTLAPQDAYAAGAGYLAGRSASMVTFHKTRGRRWRYYYTTEE